MLYNLPLSSSSQRGACISEQTCLVVPRQAVGILGDQQSSVPNTNAHSSYVWQGPLQNRCLLLFHTQHAWEHNNTAECCRGVASSCIFQYGCLCCNARCTCHHAMLDALLIINPLCQTPCKRLSCHALTCILDSNSSCVTQINGVCVGLCRW